METPAAICAILASRKLPLPSDALNAVCPYFTMYPLDFPLGILARHARANDWVLDPFCGRGTTNFAARLRGLPSYGIDASPVAAAIARAKTVYAPPFAVAATARKILTLGAEPRDVPRGSFWRSAYRMRTLRDLCILREELLRRCDTPSRVLLRAIILGALHGPRPKGEPSHFSNQCPRTFAPKPAYAVRFWRARGMKAPRVDSLKIIETRAGRYLGERVPTVDGCIVLGDARELKSFDGAPRCRWVITSPPYYGMRTYLPDQWLRHWFLGGPAEVEYSQSRSQLDHTGVERFTEQLAQVWRNAAMRAHQDVRLVVRFGGIHDRAAEPMDLLRESLRRAGWRLRTAHRASEAARGRRQVFQFQDAPKHAIVEYDAYAELV
jgi:hypothetical protein